ncbi:MAG: transposase [bacterium]
MNRKIKFSEGEYYHIYNRGVDKREIFVDGQCCDRFVLLLYYANMAEPVHIQRLFGQGLPLKRQGESLTGIGAWCLMPNHFHLLVRAKTDGGLSKFLAKLQTGYSMYFNKRNERSGSLFQGVFKAEHVDKDEYLKYLYSYIHLNPVKLIKSDWRESGIGDINKTKKFLNSYKYSSYPDYFLTNRRESVILNKEIFPEYFDNIENFQKNIFGWLEFDPSRTHLDQS